MSNDAGKHFAEQLTPLAIGWTAALGAATVVLYAAGYLSLRCQLTALGFAAELHVIDERSLFAGASILLYLVPVLASSLVLAAGPCDPGATPESLWQKVLRIAGIPAMPGEIRGSADDFAGELYLTTADGQGARKRLTEGGGFRSPIFGPDDEHVLALWHGQLVRVATGRGVVAPEPLLDLPGVTRLAGLSEADPLVLVVLHNDGGHQRPVLVCLDSLRLAELPDDREPINDLLNRLRSAERRYGETVLLTKTHADGKGSDVQVWRSERAAIDVSRCRGDFCGQGALSRDGRRVVFVRTSPP